MCTVLQVAFSEFCLHVCGHVCAFVFVCVCGYICLYVYDLKKGWVGTLNSRVENPKLGFKNRLGHDSLFTPV